MIIKGLSPVSLVACPSCGKHMRLATREPEGDARERMTFECDCGFDYQHSLVATAEQTL